VPGLTLTEHVILAEAASGFFIQLGKGTPVDAGAHFLISMLRGHQPTRSKAFRAATSSGLCLLCCEHHWTLLMLEQPDARSGY